MPYCPTGEVNDGVPSAVGNYVNFLQLGQTVLAPVYNIREDEKALGLLARVFPESNIVPVDCRLLARMGGGVLNCISWTIRS